MTPVRRKLALAVDLGGHNIRAAVVDREGTILLRRQVPTAKGRKLSDVVRQLAELTGDLAASLPKKKGTVCGVGMGVPGFMDHDRGFLYSSPNFPAWTKLNLGEILRGKVSLPLLTENDANCAAIGEWWKGAARGTQTAVCFTLGTGVGGGVIVGGELLKGSHGLAGELGHIVVDPKGPVCGCGSRGCLEAMASGTALERESGLSGEELGRRAQRGNRKALAAFEKAGRSLGIAFASYCQIFDPDILVLGGKISKAFSLLEAAIRAEMKERLKGHPARAVKVVPAQCGDDAGLLGAAYLAFETYGEPSTKKR